MSKDKYKYTNILLNTGRYLRYVTSFPNVLIFMVKYKQTYSHMKLLLPQKKIYNM